MLYEEFLRKSGATGAQVSFKQYSQLIEKAYMERDQLFPDQDAVIRHYRKTGLAGFMKAPLDGAEALRKAMESLRRASYRDSFAAMLDLALASVGQTGPRD